MYQKEEAQCKSRIGQIDDTLALIEEFEDTLASALNESDIEMLKSYSERKQYVTQFTTNSTMKELQ